MNAQETMSTSWWTTGDMPVRATSQLAFLVDGRMTMLEMCIGFLRARQNIHITAFGLSPELLLVRGKHKCAGPPNSDEQEELLDWLREKELSEEDIRFWQDCEELSVSNVLRHIISKNVDVRVLLWDTYTLPFHPGPKDVQKQLEELGVRCMLDDSHKGLLNHPLEAHHQKTATIDGQFAFVGGIDVMVNSNGEYDRWDTKGHHYITPLRLDKNGKMPHSWHDVHVLFGGPAVADVEHNFAQRWNALIELHKADPALILPASTEKQGQFFATHPQQTAKSDNPASIQVLRTIPNGTYAFTAQGGITTILDAYQRAFTQAKKYIYMENQYLWQRTFLGFENPALGIPHPAMEDLLHKLAEALTRGVTVILILPDNPNVGREFTDEGLQALRKLAPEAASAGRLQAYMLGSSMQKEGQTYYRSIYVHAKTTIVDDNWVTLGSANLNNRGMCDDTEMNVAIFHSHIVQRLRILLMTEHMGLHNEDTLFRMLDTRGKLPFREKQNILSALKRWTPSWVPPGRFLPDAVHSVLSSETADETLEANWKTLLTQFGDPVQSSALFAKQAQENLLAVKAGQPLTGHLLPYISHDQAEEYGVEVHPTNGWLDILPTPPLDAHEP